LSQVAVICVCLLAMEQLASPMKLLYMRRANGRGQCSSLMSCVQLLILGLATELRGAGCPQASQNLSYVGCNTTVTHVGHVGCHMIGSHVGHVGCHMTVSHVGCVAVHMKHLGSHMIGVIHVSDVGEHMIIVSHVGSIMSGSMVSNVGQPTRHVLWSLAGGEGCEHAVGGACSWRRSYHQGAGQVEVPEGGPHQGVSAACHQKQRR
jgi:hypothetical protein